MCRFLPLGGEILCDMFTTVCTGMRIHKPILMPFIILSRYMFSRLLRVYIHWCACLSYHGIFGHTAEIHTRHHLSFPLPLSPLSSLSTHISYTSSVRHSSSIPLSRRLKSNTRALSCLLSAAQFLTTRREIPTDPKLYHRGGFNYSTRSRANQPSASGTEINSTIVET
jgi:hypothetical protein